jgi:hypothetical protein
LHRRALVGEGSHTPRRSRLAMAACGRALHAVLRSAVHYSVVATQRSRLAYAAGGGEDPGDRQDLWRPGVQDATDRAASLLTRGRYCRMGKPQCDWRNPIRRFDSLTVPSYLRAHVSSVCGSSPSSYGSVTMASHAMRLTTATARSSFATLALLAVKGSCPSGSAAPIARVAPTDG